MTIHELQVKDTILDPKQLDQIKGGTDSTTTSTSHIISGDTDVF